MLNIRSEKAVEDSTKCGHRYHYYDVDIEIMVECDRIENHIGDHFYHLDTMFIESWIRWRNDNGTV